MTCIVGLVHHEVVYIGGDSAGVARLRLTVRADEKVFRNSDFLMGFTTSFRMGQLLRYSLKPPRRHPDDDIHQYMVVDFINAIRECLKAGGCASKEDEVESGGTFLVGYAGHLFTVDSDYQVGIPEDGYAAVGSGQDIALGALFATQGQAPRQRVLTALRSAERFNAGVRGPFHILPESEPQLGKPPPEPDIDKRVL